jgi:hypothetical protein
VDFSKEQVEHDGEEPQQQVKDKDNHGGERYAELSPGRYRQDEGGQTSQKAEQIMTDKNGGLSS